MQSLDGGTRDDALNGGNGFSEPVSSITETSETRLADGPYSLVMTGLFRLVFGQLLGFQPSAPWYPAHESYRGLVAQAQHLYTSASSASEREQAVGALFAAFPRWPQLLQHNRASCEALGLLTMWLFPFLVGTCSLEDWKDAPAGECWRSKVKIKRCKFLEESGCKGMCLSLCKEPSERYFASIGLPVSFTPDFHDGSCEMCWGRTPEDDDLAAQDLRCSRGCALATLDSSRSAHSKS